jgi:predicted DsbA family dithiol-disulfide isomerase
VLAASAQGHRAGEALDAALRRAFWTHSRSIAHRGVILDVAAETASAEPSSGLNVDALTEALDTGAYRHLLRRDYRIARGDAVPGSPTVVLPEASVSYNPGITVHWEGPWAEGFPVVDEFDAAAQVDLLARAALAAATRGTAGTSR